MEDTFQVMDRDMTINYHFNYNPNKVPLTCKQAKGFTLVELMIALAISSFLLLGIVSTYSSIQGTIQASQELENSQEVIRYSAKVFTRSLKQSNSATVINAGRGITVTLPANSSSCLGTKPAANFSETYSFVAPNLLCSLNGAPAVTLLTGMSDLQFIAVGVDLITVRVSPLVLSQNFVNGSIDIDIALTSRILSNALL